MTRCKHCSYNYQLKSSAYNQTGQCYEVQLAAYNAMTNHLRRILLAKSVVDCGRVSNRPNTSRRTKTPKLPKRNETNGAIRESLSEKLINRLAYDTKHHPHEIANMSWRSRSAGKKGFRSNSTDSSEDSSLRDHQGSMKSSREKFRAGSTGRNIDTRFSSPTRRSGGSNVAKKRHKTDFEEQAEDSGESDDFLGLKKPGRFNREEERHGLKTFRGSIPCIASGSEISFPGTPELPASRIGSNYNVDRFSNDVSIYVKFVYDITKEVMDRGYYSDREIERVFEKHFERNLGILNENKMLREINSLKRALNMKCESGDEEEEDTAVGSKRSFAKLKETTRTLDKRVVINEEIAQDPGTDLEIQNAGNTSEPINPRKEIIVTKDDILTTLLEMDLNPEKAQEICKSLENRSKEVRVRRLEKRLPTENGDEDDLRSSRSEIAKLSADFTAELNPQHHSETTLPGSSSKPKREDRIDPRPVLTGEKVDKAVQSFPNETPEELEEGNGGKEFEKFETEETSEDLATESQFDKKSGVESIGEEINDSNNHKASKSDNNTEAIAVKSKRKRKLNKGVKIDLNHTASEAPGNPSPQSLDSPENTPPKKPELPDPEEE